MYGEASVRSERCRASRLAIFSVEEGESALRRDRYGAVMASTAQPRWPARVPQLS
jgi:hypothetical protein